MASLGRNTERARKCYREKYGVTRGKYKWTPWVFGRGIKACICLGPGVCKGNMFAWMDNCYTQGWVLGRWLPDNG